MTTSVIQYSFSSAFIHAHIDCGKTHAVIELPSQHWGFYFNASSDDLRSSDMIRLHSTIQSTWMIPENLLLLTDKSTTRRRWCSSSLGSSSSTAWMSLAAMNVYKRKVDSLAIMSPWTVQRSLQYSLPPISQVFRSPWALSLGFGPRCVRGYERMSH